MFSFIFMFLVLAGDCECEAPSGASCIGGLLDTDVGIGSVPAGTPVTFTLTGWLYDCDDIVCPAVDGGVVSMATSDGMTTLDADGSLVCPGGETILGEYLTIIDPADINHQVGGVRVFMSWGESTWCLGCEEPSGYNGATASMQLGTTVLIEGFKPMGVGDINGDGNVNVLDLILVVEAWGTINTAVDVPGAGGPPSEAIIDIADLVAVITAWEEAQ